MTSIQSSYHTLTHPSGASAKIHFQGATVTSFVPSSETQDLLFVSESNTWSPEDAIRGGVPVVFPQFGKELDPSMAQHGFLRSNVWKLLNADTTDPHHARNCASAALSDESPVSARFEIDESCIVRNAAGTPWEGRKFTATYTITIHANDNTALLSADLLVTNTGSDEFEFSNLLHTYYAVEDSTKLSVTGLKNYQCIDTMINPTRDPQKSFVMGSDPITIDSEVDRIFYQNDGKQDVAVLLQRDSSDPTKDVRIFSTSDISGTSEEVSCVVWNPWIEKSKRMSNFDDDGYKRMVCVEPGIIRGGTTLPAGKTVRLTVSSECSR